MDKIIRIFSKIFGNSAFMALCGVVVGGLITGYYSYKTQMSIITAQENQFKSAYMIEKNKAIKEDIKYFINDLSFVITSSNGININKRDSIEQRMISTSLRIMLLEDYMIGTQCFKLSNAIHTAFKSNTVDDVAVGKILLDWTISIKSEMKKVDYTIDEKSLERDLLMLMLNNFGEQGSDKDK